MTIKTSTQYKTTDGKSFDTRKDAETHQKFITRQAAIEKALVAAGYNLDDAAGTIADAARFVAEHGDQFQVALTVPSNRGPKKGTTKAAA